MSQACYMVVIDPTQDDNPAYDRAVEMALSTHASLHLYSCTCKPPHCEEAGGPIYDLMTFRDLVRDNMRAMADSAREKGLTASLELNCGPDWRPEMLTAARRCEATLIFKYSVVVGQFAERSGSGDWVLMRGAPCPVLFVHGGASLPHRCMLAALRPSTPDGLHDELNRGLLQQMEEFYAREDSDRHIVSVNEDGALPVDTEALTELSGLALEKLHVADGAPAEAILSCAMEQQADLLLIGTIARSGLVGLAKGNTVERLLDRASCDVLVLVRQSDTDLADQLQ